MGKKKNKKTTTSSTEPANVAPREIPQPPRTRGISTGQFTGVLLLTIGLVCLFEYATFLRNGADSLACGNYIHQQDGLYMCTELDTVMIRIKFYGAISPFLSVAACTIHISHVEKTSLSIVRNSFLEQ